MAKLFRNELGNQIVLDAQVSMHEDGYHRITVTGKGPNSQFEHVWTLKEAMKLLQLLQTIPLPKVR